MTTQVRPFRHTKIIATLGPATESKEMLTKLILAGVDIMRLNMAHATHQWVDDAMWFIREASNEVGRHVCVMMDVKGPEIRTGKVDAPIELEVGDLFEIHTEDTSPTGDIPAVTTNYPGLPADVDVGTVMLIDSGLIRMKVVAKDDQRIRLETLTPGTIGSKRHINLPGVFVNLPCLTAKDQDDLRAGVRAGIDYVALSFVRQASDIRELRAFLDSLGSSAKIIAKIEDQAGVRNMHEIIAETNAVMIARGDLGIEIDYHRLPLVQTELVAACRAAGKPVIVATHLLETMISAPMPTRAEISDVSNAVREQADAVMLSGETTVGQYPLEAVQVMKNVINSIEPSIDSDLNRGLQLVEPKHWMLLSAAKLAQNLGESAIVVFTRRARLAKTLAALRPRGVPIFAFAPTEDIFRQMLMLWGVEPFLMNFYDDPEETILQALQTLRDKNWIRPGRPVVVVTNVLARGKVVETLQLRTIE
ncbi:pyruvate kinase [Actomonas aquatica]|uniref:Pyruvate kinase n=1 Tax=Actomonas aquatica TaxID=2866162 RepID=A0ABZ1C2B8_9BACT|nr:pyruvate kinase [Opitutus sp. WL0086]WRQ85841.1 pyruvate kinase [Opitutus sp. WL0086]